RADRIGRSGGGRPWRGAGRRSGALGRERRRPAPADARRALIFGAFSGTSCRPTKGTQSGDFSPRPSANQPESQQTAGLSWIASWNSALSSEGRSLSPRPLHRFRSRCMSETSYNISSLSPDEKRRLLARLLKEKAEARPGALSYGQRALWLLQRLDPH